MVKDFVQLTDSFNLTQHISGVTCEHSHTLDLVLSFGIPIYNVEISDFFVFDRKPVILNVTMSGIVQKPYSTGSVSCVVTYDTASHFSKIFSKLSESVPNSELGIGEMITLFNNAYSCILDSVAPLKVSKPKRRSEPWMNSNIQAFRLECWKLNGNGGKTNCKCSAYQNSVKDYFFLK